MIKAEPKAWFRWLSHSLHATKPRSTTTVVNRSCNTASTALGPLHLPPVTTGSHSSLGKHAPQAIAAMRISPRMYQAAVDYSSLCKRAIRWIIRMCALVDTPFRLVDRSQRVIGVHDLIRTRFPPSVIPAVVVLAIAHVAPVILVTHGCSYLNRDPGKMMEPSANI